MNIELASGANLQNVGEEQVKESLGSLNSNNDFLILSNGDEYIQCAWSPTGFMAEYQDNSGHYGSEPALPLDRIEQLFSSYLARSNEWRGLVSWTREYDAASQSAGSSSNASGNDTSEGVGRPDGGSSREGILDSVKRQVSREVSRGVSRKASGVIGRIIRKFF